MLSLLFLALPGLAGGSFLATGAADLIEIVLVPMLFLGTFLAGIALLLTLFLFGGTRRNALALLATGLLTLVTGTVFLAALNVAAYAKQDNAYLLNIFVGGGFILLSCIVLMGSLAGYGLNRWLAFVLGAIAVVAAGYATILGTPLDSTSGGTTLVLFGAALLAVVAAILLLRQRWLALGKGVLLSGLAAAGVLVIYGVGRQNILLLGASGLNDGVYKPPFVDWPEMLAALIAGAAIFLLARSWSKPARPEAPLPPGPATLPQL